MRKEGQQLETSKEPAAAISKGKASKVTKPKADEFSVTLNMAKMQAEQNDDLLDLQAWQRRGQFRPTVRGEQPSAASRLTRWRRLAARGREPGNILHNFGGKRRLLAADLAGLAGCC